MLSGQLNECSHKLEKLQLELKKYQGYLEEATRTQNSVNSHSQNNSPRLLNGSRRNHRNSGGSGAEEESLSRSASDSSVTNPTLNHNKSGAPHLLNHGWVAFICHIFFHCLIATHTVYVHFLLNNFCFACECALN